MFIAKRVTRGCRESVQPLLLLPAPKLPCKNSVQSKKKPDSKSGSSIEHKMLSKKQFFRIYQKIETQDPQKKIIRNSNHQIQVWYSLSRSQPPQVPFLPKLLILPVQGDLQNLPADSDQ